MGMAAVWLPLAFSAEGLIWLVIVVLSIIAQIAKASKRRPAAPAGGGENPQDELDAFLRALRGEPPPPPRPPPPPAPAKPRQPLPPRRPEITVSQDAPAQRTPPAKTGALPVAKPDAYAQRDARRWPAQNRAHILAALRDPGNRRRAIVLRDILGPCPGLGPGAR
jgi:hypothetical protein